MNIQETEILCFMVDVTEDEYLFIAIVDAQIPMMQMRRSNKTDVFSMPAENISKHELFTYYVGTQPGKMVTKCLKGHWFQYESILNNPVILLEFKMMEEHSKLDFSIEEVLRKEYNSLMTALQIQMVTLFLIPSSF